MLLLTVGVDEVIDVTLPDGRPTTIMVTRVQGKRVRLGFEAPLDVQFCRRDAANKTPRDRTSGRV